MRSNMIRTAILLGIMIIGVVVIAYLTHSLLQDLFPSAEASAKLPIGTCFQHISQLETWEKPDGTIYAIILKGIEKDLVIYSLIIDNDLYCSTYSQYQSWNKVFNTKIVNCSPELSICLNSYKEQGISTWVAK